MSIQAKGRDRREGGGGGGEEENGYFRYKMSGDQLQCYRRTYRLTVDSPLFSLSHYEYQKYISTLAKLIFASLYLLDDSVRVVFTKKKRRRRRRRGGGRKMKETNTKGRAEGAWL